MTAVPAASANLWWPDAIPIRLMSFQGTGSSFTPTRSIGPDGLASVLVMGIDVVAQQALSAQCFVSFNVPQACPIYYDSQSIGEGLGVRFSWRGQAPLLEGETMELVLSASSGNPQWSASAWGLALGFNAIT